MLPPALLNDDRELGPLFDPFLYGHHVRIESDVDLSVASNRCCMTELPTADSIPLTDCTLLRLFCFED